MLTTNHIKSRLSEERVPSSKIIAPNYLKMVGYSITPIEKCRSPASRFVAIESLDDECEDDKKWGIRDSLSCTNPNDNFVSDQIISTELDETCAKNIEMIITWVIKNKKFLEASFERRLEKWVNTKLSQDRSFEKHESVLRKFEQELMKTLQHMATIDVRKETAAKKVLNILNNKFNETYPDPSACFIDAVVGLTDIEERCSDIKSNTSYSLLRDFLAANRHFADYLANALPKLDEVANLWCMDEKELDKLAPKSPLKSPTKPQIKCPPLSPGKSPLKPIRKENLSMGRPLIKKFSDPNEDNKIIRGSLTSLFTFNAHDKLLKRDSDDISQGDVHSSQPAPKLIKIEPSLFKSMRK